MSSLVSMRTNVSVLPLSVRTDAGVLPLTVRTDAGVLPLTVRTNTVVLPVAMTTDADVLTVTMRSMRTDSGVLSQGEDVSEEEASLRPEPFFNPYDLGRRRNWSLVMSPLGPARGDGISWPVRAGCDQYTLTVRQPGWYQGGTRVVRGRCQGGTKVVLGCDQYTLTVRLLEWYQGGTKALLGRYEGGTRVVRG